MMPNIQDARFAPALELPDVAPRAFHHRLHEIVGVVLVARQRAREAAQPRQQRDDAFTISSDAVTMLSCWIIRLATALSSMDNAQCGNFRGDHPSSALALA